MSAVWLIGDPVAHSLSPAMHNAAFAALGLPHRYEAREVKTDQLAATIERMRREDVLGANVTIPHKETVLRLIARVSDEARRIGAVNTITRRGGQLDADNTDGYGFRLALDEARLQPARVIVLGAGGAARACVVELLRMGAEVLVANRTRDRADRLARSIELEGRRARAIAWPSQQDLDDTDAVVNATPLGLQNEDPLRGRLLHGAVIDLVPTAEPTPLVKRAKAIENVVVVDGL
ncbi:MAG TPA: shikimate dehydrogenase, partial [Candidatus Limnocylindria bacterium]|nr:shikimate dehydrogenase [Candidatus Limnocylindria bacterium]